MDLTLLAAAIIAFGIIMYVVMDGFDLGIGILFPWAASDAERNVMMNSVAPIWDGNETWLVLGGVTLLAAFPVAYSQLLPAFYLPLIVMLFGLVFRGIAFEFRFKAHRLRWVWNLSFAMGSLLAALAQGFVLGAFIDAYGRTGEALRTGPFGWLSLFSVVTGLGIVAGYALLGATWLVMKTQGHLQAWARRMAQRMLLVLLVFILIVSLHTGFLNPRIAERWFSLPNFLFLSPVPMVTAGLALALWRGLEGRHEARPFLCAIGLFVLSYLGLGISLWPIIVPPDVTIWDAAARSESQVFVLVGDLLTLPFVLAYTGYSYYVFRGKVAEGAGYH